VFGRAMRDFIPSLPHKYEPAKDWAVTQEYRERTLAMKREADREKWSHKTRDLEMLEIGTPVMIQNQTGNNPTKWDKTGVVLENKPHSQVLIRVDGSRRVTLRNRRFIKKLDPELRRMPNPVPVQPKPVKKRVAKSVSTVPEVQQEPPVAEVPEAPLGVENEPALHDEVREVVDEQVEQAELVDADNIDVDVPAGQLLPAQPEAELAAPVIDQPRPKRSPKPNPKYSSEVYDLSYVGAVPRVRSRRSIRRAGM